MVPLRWSERPSDFFSSSPLRAPAASFTRPLALSRAPSCLSSRPVLSRLPIQAPPRCRKRLFSPQITRKRRGSNFPIALALLTQALRSVPVSASLYRELCRPTPASVRPGPRPPPPRRRRGIWRPCRHLRPSPHGRTSSPRSGRRCPPPRRCRPRSRRDRCPGRGGGRKCLASAPLRSCRPIFLLGDLLLRPAKRSDLDAVLVELPGDGLGQPDGAGGVAVNAHRVGAHLYVRAALRFHLTLRHGPDDPVADLFGVELLCHGAGEDDLAVVVVAAVGVELRGHRLVQLAGELVGNGGLHAEQVEAGIDALDLLDDRAREPLVARGDHV